MKLYIRYLAIFLLLLLTFAVIKLYFRSGITPLTSSLAAIAGGMTLLILTLNGLKK